MRMLTRKSKGQCMVAALCAPGRRRLLAQCTNNRRRTDTPKGQAWPGGSVVPDGPCRTLRIASNP